MKINGLTYLDILFRKKRFTIKRRLKNFKIKTTDLILSISFQH